MAHGEATIVVNGEARPLGPGGLVDLLRALGHDPARPGVAIAVNDEVVPRTRWEQCRLADGDRVEIVGAVQGG